jgi:HPt (histidine-containing phosphotransfer) domain-containing protein
MARSAGAVRAAVCGSHGPPCDRTVQAEILLKKRDGAAGRLVAPLTAMGLSATEPPMLDVTEPPVLDVLVMAAIRALGVPGEPDVYAEVARLFLTDVPIHLFALGAAIAADRIEAVGQIAHRLRGSALEMGALRMAPVCGAIEHGARSGSLEHAAEQADRLACEFASARRELEQVIQ